MGAALNSDVEGEASKPVLKDVKDLYARTFLVILTANRDRQQTSRTN